MQFYGELSSFDVRLGLLRPDMGAKYCDKRVCMYVCLSVCPLACLKNHMSILIARVPENQEVKMVG